ncbi:YopX family protein [Mediterraneibacter glycyrrhizinilyticus]|uniref:YopX family protein n=1 Tax=Mediterraneibacter glycyrrhizinilyticus TaxID=342942 RepID=UPI001D06AA61|nr:YopX family protein [Mediterraneibacter glycyrrhizinilyticus]MCB6310078.1 YopX family protein [Lachnospiraceae bacterium 210521-DFI.1.109]MCB6427438.1 YopX family protein [Mediterraneibacter glycyrrhizinilyticus]
MNREILFKAKRKDNGEWVEGNLITNERNENQKYIGYIFDERNGVIEDFDLVEVIPDTICQYTGLTDKNGRKIWENDITYIRSSGLSGYGVIKYQNGNLVLVDEKRKRTYSLYGEWKIRKDGNIFDNAELLEVE